MKRDERGQDGFVVASERRVSRGVDRRFELHGEILRLPAKMGHAREAPRDHARLRFVLDERELERIAQAAIALGAGMIR